MPHNAAKARPQPGSHHRPAPDSSAHQDKASAQQPSPSVHPVEPEDARVTGTSRSLQRRVLGLNVDGHQSQQHPESVPAQHATGSFTGKGSNRRKG
ncbi:MAG TPA: hypothetical protein VMD25_12685 [Acidobacteriaceae bacterium]|nr:hypothetical protein [Acidobacteriaceae bacterium]